MSKCPCGNSKPYEACCGAYITGKTNAPTAEALMRARYSAFVKGEIEFIKESYDPLRIDEFDENSVRQWSKEADWDKLEVISTEAGKESDFTGKVEFVAHYSIKNQKQAHHELAVFRKDENEGKWYFVDGNTPKLKPIMRDQPKVGRNDPCSCGSGMKFKKCCGK